MGHERRWVTPVRLAVLGLVVAANAAGSVGFGTAGRALLVTLGVAGYIATSLLFLLWVDAPARSPSLCCWPWRPPRR